MIPKEYGGGGLSNVDLILAAEEICAVDPGFACTILVNGLGLMPVWYWGTDEQKNRFLRAATSDPSGEYIVGYAVSEPAGTPGGTANFDAPSPHPVGIGVTARRDGDDYVLNGRKYWPCNVAGWDGQGANVSIVVVRTDPEKGGTEGLSAIMVERGTPGVSYKLISKIGHRLTPNAEIVFDNARVPARNLVEGTKGNGDLLINRNFAWSGPVAGIAAVGVARSAYEAALEWAKTYTAGGPKPIIHYQNVGYVLGDVAARIEACRYFCWKTAHYLDKHEYHGELIGAMCKIHCTELLFDAVYKCTGADQLAQDAPEVGAVGRAEPAEDPLGLGSAGRADRLEDAGAMLGQLDQGGPPVAGIGLSPGQVPGFEGVDHLGGRARRDAQVIRQVGQPHRPVAAQHPQGPVVGRRDVPGSQCLLRCLPQLARDRPERLRQGLVGVRVARGRRVAFPCHRNSLAAFSVVTSH